MKKLLSTLVVISIILLMFWAAAGWYFGTRAEQEFRAFLNESSQLVGKRLFRAELLSYKKTPSGAKAQLAISSDYPALTEHLGDLKMRVKLLSGPIFVTRSGVSFGSSRWALALEDMVETTETEAFFPNGLPSAVVRVDFEKKAHYVAKVDTHFAQSLITGVFDLTTQDNRGAIGLKNVSFGLLPYTISADDVQISYQHQKAITTRYKPGTASLQVTDLKIQHKQLSTPLVLDVKLNSNISLKEESLSGYLKADIDNAHPDDFPIENAKLSLLFNGLPADAYIAFTEANEALENLHQQAQWALEELGEVPEGQDQIWLLYDRINESADALPKILAKQVKAGDKQLVQLKVTTQYKNKRSNLDGTIKLASDSPKISSWLSLLDGEAQVELDEYLLAAVQQYLPITDAKFKLLLKDNKVLMAK